MVEALEIKKGFKKTDFGIIPNEWVVKSIQDLIDDNSITSHLDGNHGELYPKSHEFVDYGVPYIAANDFAQGTLTFDNCKFLANNRAKLFKKGIAKNGDVLFAHNATVGPVALLKTNFEYVVLSTTATYFRCNPEIISNIFLLHLMKSNFFIKQYKAVMLQSTRAQVPITAQRRLKLFLPKLAEQTAIATALNDADALITQLEKLIAKKRAIKQGAIQELLKPKPEWEVKKLGALNFDISDGNYSSKYPSSSEFKPIGIPFIRANNIKKMTIIDNDMRFISPELHVELAKGHLKTDDILITTRGEIGQIAIVPKKYIDSNINAQIVRVNTNRKINHLYFAYFLQKAETQIVFLNFQTGSALKQLPVGKLKQIEIVYPTLDEQIHIATKLSNMENEINYLEVKLEKFKMLKQGMMQNLLTGKIRLI